MNSASLVRFPQRQQAQGAQGRRSVAAAAAADRADGGGQYHGMYVAKDAVAQLAGTLPQRAVVPCFVRGARLRVCVRVSALRVCSAWLSGKRDQTTFGPASAANSWPSARRSRRAHQISAARWAHARHALRATSTSASRFEVRGRRVCRLRCYVCVRVCIIAPKSHLTAKTEGRSGVT